MIKQRAQKIELVPLDKIVLNPKNRNRHSKEQIERLCKIIEYQGFREPGTISNLSGYLCAGEGRYLAAKKLGLSHIPCIFEDFDDEDQEYAYGISTNAIASWADLNLAEINLDLADLGPFDIDLLGIKDFVVEPMDKYGDADAVPEVPKVAKSQRGELWILGDHRLLCGDATSKEDVERLMGGEKADMVFTDPPYGVNVQNTQGSIIGDQDLETFKKCLPVLKSNAVDDAHFYVWMAPGYPLPPSVQAFVENIPFQNILPVRCTHENKRGPKGAFKLNYEACLFGNDNTRGFNSSKKFPVSETTLNDDRYDGDGFLKVYPALWDGERATEHNMNIVHPTQKKVEMIEFYIEISSEPERVVLDLFLGSGSTLIACEKTKRRCFGMEICEQYIDVALDRWATFTGRDPIREDGKKWSELK